MSKLTHAWIKKMHYLPADTFEMFKPLLSRQNERQFVKTRENLSPTTCLQSFKIISVIIQQNSTDMYEIPPNNLIFIFICQTLRLNLIYLKLNVYNMFYTLINKMIIIIRWLYSSIGVNLLKFVVNVMS